MCASRAPLWRACASSMTAVGSARAGGAVQGAASWACRASAPTSPTRPSTPRSTRAPAPRTACAGGRRRPSSRSSPAHGMVTIELAEGGTLQGRARRRRRRPRLRSRARRRASPRVPGATRRRPLPPPSATRARTPAITTELHRRAGPLTTVPLPGDASSLVWVEEPAAGSPSRGPGRRGLPGRAGGTPAGVAGLAGDVGPRAVYPLAGLARPAHGPEPRRSGR